MVQKAGTRGLAAQCGERDKETKVASRIDTFLVPRVDGKKSLPAQHRQPHDTEWHAARKLEEEIVATSRGILMRKGKSHISHHRPI